MEFKDLVDAYAGLVLLTVSECYMAHGKQPSAEPSIEFTTADIINDGLEQMQSDVRVEWSHQGFMIHDRRTSLP